MLEVEIGVIESDFDYDDVEDEDIVGIILESIFRYSLGRGELSIAAFKKTDRTANSLLSISIKFDFSFSVVKFNINSSRLSTN